MDETSETKSCIAALPQSSSFRSRSPDRDWQAATGSPRRPPRHLRPALRSPACRSPRARPRRQRSRPRSARFQRRRLCGSPMPGRVSGIAISTAPMRSARRSPTARRIIRSPTKANAHGSGARRLASTASSNRRPTGIASTTTTPALIDPSSCVTRNTPTATIRVSWSLSTIRPASPSPTTQAPPNGLRDMTPALAPCTGRLSMNNVRRPMQTAGASGRPRSWRSNRLGRPTSNATPSGAPGATSITASSRRSGTRNALSGSPTPRR